MNRYQFNFRHVADQVMEELGLGQREATCSVSLLAHNQEEAVALAGEMIKSISSEQWYEAFVSTIETGNYTIDVEMQTNRFTVPGE